MFTLGQFDRSSEVVVSSLPLLLESGSPYFGPVPFKWFNSWLDDPDGDDIIRKRRNDNMLEFQVCFKLERLSRKLRHIKKVVQEWRAKKKQRQLEDLQQINRKIYSDNRSFGRNG